ncbi:MAG TPA: DoxX family protein [Azonexus sp.]|nr:DoxX family protein [Azonexus sp.]HLP24380.1 DoxX family protein [Acidobacteriota bacterium]
MQKFLRLEFVPSSSDLALLTLRVALGLSMALLHGWGKLSNLIAGTSKFPDILGIGSTPALLLAIWAEFFCSLLLVFGLWTRLAALMLATTMSVAFFMAHGAKLSGPGNGELAFVYLIGYVTLLVAGAGKYSVDRK